MPPAQNIALNVPVASPPVNVRANNPDALALAVIEHKVTVPPLDIVSVAPGMATVKLQAASPAAGVSVVTTLNVAGVVPQIFISTA